MSLQKVLEPALDLSPGACHGHPLPGSVTFGIIQVLYHLWPLVGGGRGVARDERRVGWGRDGWERISKQEEGKIVVYEYI